MLAALRDVLDELDVDELGDGTAIMLTSARGLSFASGSRRPVAPSRPWHASASRDVIVPLRILRGGLQ